MSLYPKWLLALAGVNLLSILYSVFFLFGGYYLLGFREDALVFNGLSYLTTQLFWIWPCGAFFLSLLAHDRDHLWLSVITALSGIACMVGAICYLAGGGGGLV